jgi:hypothetical protein
MWSLFLKKIMMTLWEFSALSRGRHPPIRALISVSPSIHSFESLSNHSVSLSPSIHLKILAERLLKYIKSLH